MIKKISFENLFRLFLICFILYFSYCAAEENPPEIAYDSWPFSGSEANRRVKETSEAKKLSAEKKVFLGDGVEINMILIPPGKFIMGMAEPVMPDTNKINQKIFYGKCFSGIGILIILY